MSLGAKPFILKSVSIACSFSCKSNTFSFEWFRTMSRFETEAKINTKRFLINFITRLSIHFYRLDPKAAQRLDGQILLRLQDLRREVGTLLRHLIFSQTCNRIFLRGDQLGQCSNPLN